MNCHDKIRKYIEDNGIKLNFVADKAGIPEKTFYRLISGNKKMTVEELEKICINGLSKEPSFFLNETSH